MTSRRSLGCVSCCVAGLIALATSAQAAPEARAKTEGQRPSVSEPRAVGTAKGSEHAKAHVEKGEETEHHHGPKGEGAPSASGIPMPVPSGSAGPEGGRHHEGRADESKRHEQRLSKLRELRGQWGQDTLKLPAVREELEHHAWRLARLKRMRDLATEKKNDKVLSKVDKLEQKENTRHEKAMARLKSQGSAATPEGSAMPTPSAIPSVGHPHEHGAAKKANAGGKP